MVLAAAAVAALVGCAKETVSEQASSSGKLVDVKFTAEIPAYQTTKSTVDVNGLTFNTRWADGDKMGIRYQHLAEDSEADGYNLSASYSNGVFSTKLPEYKGIWYYNAYYPYQAADDENAHYVNIPFGAERIQNGNDINSAYDIMCAKYMEFDDAEQGKTDGGKDISFDMVRQTALLYFHLTSQDIDEPLTKATLSVEGDPIAAEAYSMYYSGNNLDKNTYGTAWTTGDSQSITLTFTNAPSSKDFKLWFNILPTVEGLRGNGVKNMKLVVETESKTLTLTAPAEELYFPGYISKVEILDVASTNWKDKETPVTTPVYEKVTSALTDWSGDYLIVYEDASSKNPSPVVFDGSLTELDKEGNTKSVVISDNKIEATTEMDAVSFTIAVIDGGYSIQSTSGSYIGWETKDKNGLKKSSTASVNTISYESSTVTIKGVYGSLKYNAASNQNRFRYYTSGQKAIALYKRSEAIPVAPFITLTPESGSVAADATSASFEVKSNVDWTVSTDAGWVTLGTTSGSNDGTVALSFTANAGEADRTATVTVGSADATISRTYTLVQKKVGGSEKTETYSFASFVSADDVTLTAANFTIKMSKGTGSTQPAWVSSEARLYPNGTMTISSTKKIVKVEFDYTINANKKGKKPTISSVRGGASDGGNWDETKMIWENSVGDTLIVMSTTGSAGNIGFKSITVTFVEE